MDNSTQGLARSVTDDGARAPRRRGARGADQVRTALVDAAVAFLQEQAPSSVSGRDLAARAGVNYGLVHHYFGGKEAVFRAALIKLRDEFHARHQDPSSTPFITDIGDPYLRAVVRSQLDAPVNFDDDYPIGSAVVRGVRGRLPPDASDAEAKARAIAMISLQVAYNVFQSMLLDSTSTAHRERRAVEAELSRLYDELGLLTRDGES